MNPTSPGGNEKIEAGPFFFTGRREPAPPAGGDHRRGFCRKALFASEELSIRLIEIDGHQVEVLGVLARPSASLSGQKDRRVLLPYFTMRKMFPTARENMITFCRQAGQAGRGHRRGRRGAAPAAQGCAQQAGQLLDLHRAADDRPIPRHYLDGGLVLVVLSSIGLLVGGIAS